MVGVVGGAIFGYFFPFIINMLSNSLYDRTNIEKIMVEFLGDSYFGDALTDELLVVAYDYNSQEPRFFSKYFSVQNAGIYDVLMSDACGASSAAPTYFDPKTYVNSFGLTELQIDGGIICNNPALYAYNIATKLREKQNIRLLSIGTGEKPFSKFESADDFTKGTYIKNMGEFMMNMDTYTADWYLQNQFKLLGQEDDYLRMQTNSAIGMDKVDKENIDGLKADGLKLYKENKVKLEKMITTILDEKFKTV